MKKLLSLFCMVFPIALVDSAYAAQVSDDRIISYCMSSKLPTPIENIVCDYLDENDVAIEEQPRVLSVEESCIGNDAFERRYAWDIGYLRSEEEPTIDSYEVWKYKQPTQYNYTPLFLPTYLGGFYMIQQPTVDYSCTSYTAYQYYVVTKEAEIVRIRGRKAERELEVQMRKTAEIRRQSALLEEYINYCKAALDVSNCRNVFFIGDNIVAVFMRNQARELRAPYQKPIEPVIEPVQELVPVAAIQQEPVVQQPVVNKEQEPISIQVQQAIVEPAPLLNSLPGELPVQPAVTPEPQKQHVKRAWWNKPATYIAVASIVCIGCFLWYLKKTK